PRHPVTPAASWTPLGRVPGSARREFENHMERRIEPQPEPVPFRQARQLPPVPVPIGVVHLPIILLQPPMDASSDAAHISEETRHEPWEVVQDLEVRRWHHVRHHPTPPDDAEPLEKFSYGLIIK